MWTTEEFRQHLRAALVHLYDPRYLRSSPLAACLGLERRDDVSLALQNVLIEAIDSLKPGADAAPESRASRIYYLLLYRYVQQLSQEEVADQLGLSVRHLRREQKAALHALARRLRERFHLLEQTGDRAVGADTALPVGIPGLEDELAWLKDAPVSEPADVAQAVAGAIELARPLAQQRGTRLEAAQADAPSLLAVHPIALRQILLNLLGVAISRTPGGVVRVTAKPAACEVEIQLACAQARPGPRPPLDQEGDALQVARRLADLCRGRVSFAEDGLFRASLVVPSLEQASVVVIDDNAETLEFLQRYALGTRYRLACTRDPSQAESLVAECSPQAIILDVMMPRLDGWTVLSQLHQHPLTRHIPIVVCTVMPQEALALSLGAHAFLRKPVTRQAFLAALDRAVAAQESGSR